MSVLIIGSNGFLGRVLCDTLGTAGIDVLRASSSDGTGIDPRTGLLPDSFAVPASVDAVIYLSQSPAGLSAGELGPNMIAVQVHSLVRAASLGA